MTRLVRSLAAPAAASVLGVLLVHAWFSISTGYDVNLVSGVWLAHARDLQDGLLYRDLSGTRRLRRRAET